MLTTWNRCRAGGNDFERRASSVAAGLTILLLLIGQTAVAAGDRRRGVDADGNTAESATTETGLGAAGGIRSAAQAAATACSADPQCFDEQADFLAAAGAPLLEDDFQSYSLVGGLNAGGLSLMEFDEFVATCQEDLPSLKILDRAARSAFGNHDPTQNRGQYLSADTDKGLDQNGVGSAHVTLTFDAPIVEFGFYLVDLDLNTMDMEVTISNRVYGIPNHGDAGETYFGFIGDPNEPFTKVEVGDPSGAESFYTIDDVAFVHYVPEPGTALLHAAAFSTLAALRIGSRRRLRRSRATL